MKSTQPVSRRRRKRLRPAPASDSQDKVNQSKVSSSSFDDTELHFLDNSGDFLSDREATLASIPMLLAERQTRLPRKRPQTWQREVMQTFVKKPEGRGKSHRQWRDFSKREIPFTKLGTPMSDAVLGMDRQGSYVVCLGAQGCRKTPLALAIRIYGKFVIFHARLCKARSHHQRLSFFQGYRVRRVRARVVVHNFYRHRHSCMSSRMRHPKRLFSVFTAGSPRPAPLSRS